MIDAVKQLELLREKIKSENPDYSEKEVSAYVAGMIRHMRESEPPREIKTAVKYLNQQYEIAKRMEYVNKPLAWALYQTWRYFDKKEKVGNTKECEK